MEKRKHIANIDITSQNKCTGRDRNKTPVYIDVTHFKVDRNGVSLYIDSGIMNLNLYSNWY